MKVVYIHVQSLLAYMKIAYMKVIIVCWHYESGLYPYTVITCLYENGLYESCRASALNPETLDPKPRHVFSILVDPYPTLLYATLRFPTLPYDTLPNATLPYSTLPYSTPTTRGYRVFRVEGLGLVSSGSGCRVSSV